MTTQRYHCFTVRTWDSGEAQRGIEVRHMQSGERVRVPSTGAAAAWIGDRARSQGNESMATESDPSRGTPECGFRLGIF